jgi:hypothetical protein
MLIVAQAIEPSMNSKACILLVLLTLCDLGEAGISLRLPAGIVA